MSTKLFNIMCVFVVIFLISIVFVCDYYKYLAIKEYFPNLTYFDYTFLSKNILITPK